MLFYKLPLDVRSIVNRNLVGVILIGSYDFAGQVLQPRLIAEPVLVPFDFCFCSVLVYCVAFFFISSSSSSSFSLLPLER